MKPSDMIRNYFDQMAGPVGVRGEPDMECVGPDFTDWNALSSNAKMWIECFVSTICDDLDAAADITRPDVATILMGPK